MKALAILTVKNEGAFLLEWLAHHRAVGFDDFLVYSNDCSDGTDLMLDRLAAMGWLTHVRNDGPHPQGPQWAALKAADRHPAKAAADWVLFIDIDEFVNIHAGGRRLQNPVQPTVDVHHLVQNPPGAHVKGCVTVHGCSPFPRILVRRCHPYCNVHANVFWAGRREGATC